MQLYTSDGVYYLYTRRPVSREVGALSAELEQQWIAAAASGSEDAYARLVEAYQVPVFNLAYRMLGNANEAEDAAQETFIRAYSRLHTYNPQLKFSSWILAIASHYCIDRLRRRHGTILSMEEIMGQRWIPDEHAKPEEQALQREESALVRQTLEKLPAPYRLVIVLRYWNDLGYEEIADVTGESISAIKSRLHRAREMMATFLSSRESEANPQKQERRIPGDALFRCI